MTIEIPLSLYQALPRPSWQAVYSRIRGRVTDSDFIICTVASLMAPPTPGHRRIGSRYTIYRSLHALRNLRMVDVFSGGGGRGQRLWITLLPLQPHHVDELRFALERVRTWKRDRIGTLCDALESPTPGPNFWGHVAPEFHGETMVASALLRTGFHQPNLFHNAVSAVAGFPVLRNHSGAHQKKCALERRKCAPEGLSVHLNSLEVCTGGGCQVHTNAFRDFPLCSSVSLQEGGPMSDWDYVDELPEGVDPRSLRKRKKKIANREPEEVEDIPAPPPPSRPRGRPINPDHVIEPATWEPWSEVLSETNALFRTTEAAAPGKDGIIRFYADDPAPKRFIREISLVKAKDTSITDPRVSRESIDVPIAIARFIRHHTRLLEGNAGTYTLESVGNIRALVTPRAGLKLPMSSIQLGEALAGYAYTVRTAIDEGKAQFAPRKCAVLDLLGGSGFPRYRSAWDAAVASGLDPDPWAYIASLPDLSLKAASGKTQVESSPKGLLDALLARYEASKAEKASEAKYDAEHGPGAFQALPMVNRIQKVCGVDAAVDYERLTEELHDLPTAHLGRP